MRDLEIAGIVVGVVLAVVVIVNAKDFFKFIKISMM